VHEVISLIARFSGISRISMFLHGLIVGNHIRIFNYHDVPMDEREAFEKQVDYILSKYDAISPERLNDYLNGDVELDHPAAVFTFDDGFVSHATYVADYLSSKGVVGWFFIPTAATNTSVQNHLSWALSAEVFRKAMAIYSEKQIFADWDMWRAIKDKHVLASHTHDHLRFRSSVTKSMVKFQLEESMRILEQELGVTQKYFCYVGGEYTSYSRHACEAIRELDVDLAFTTCSLVAKSDTDRHRLERTNLESSFSISRVLLCCSGIVDIRYWSKRRRLQKVFSKSLSS